MEMRRGTVGITADTTAACTVAAPITARMDRPLAITAMAQTAPITRAAPTTPRGAAELLTRPTRPTVRRIQAAAAITHRPADPITMDPAPTPLAARPTMVLRVRVSTMRVAPPPVASHGQAAAAVDGHPGRIAIAAGAVCTLADSAAEDLAVVGSVVEVSDDRAESFFMSQARIGANTAHLWLSIVVALIIAFISCNKSAKNQGEQPPNNAGPKTFASQDDAGAALVEAAKSGDQQKLLAIFGPDAQNVVFTGDATKDKDNQTVFVDAYNEMHRWGPIKAGGEVLYVGADNFVFPIPLDRNKDGKWFFDTAAGKDEILARRIGNGELTAMAVVQAIADAEHQYFKQAHDGVKQYTQKFVSDEGKHNGLYWPVQEGHAPSPLGPVADFAKALGYSNAGDKPQAFNGYYFRILTKQGDSAKGGAKDYIVDGKMTGGFAILAYPVRYRDTGIMTFIMDQNGVLYQKDLGEKTDSDGSTMASYNPGEGWQSVTGNTNPTPAQAKSKPSNRNDASNTADLRAN